MSFEKYLANQKAIIITLDDALFPKKDYLLQVYYLFAEFMAYSAQIDSKAMLDFMREKFLAEGDVDIFEKTALEFRIAAKYKQNFNLLHETARLPLKLLLYQQVLKLLKEAAASKMTVFLLAEGNPQVAINKIKQVEWNDLERYLKVYFTNEFEDSVALTLTELLRIEGFNNEEVVLFSSQNQFDNNFVNATIKCFSVAEIL